MAFGSVKHGKLCATMLGSEPELVLKKGGIDNFLDVFE